MNNINKYVEHTLLKQDATKADLDKLLNEAIEYNFLGVCVNPVNVAYAKSFLQNTNIKVVTVIGFPLGANLTTTKVQETIATIEAGADEVDMVLNVSALKNNNDTFILDDISAVVKAAKDIPVKVIIETDLLTKDEVKKASLLAAQAGAKFLKTSTGFVKNGVGAKVEDVEIMTSVAKEYNIQVKASGGIKTFEDAKKLITAGATRLGTSSGVQIVQGAKS